MEEDILSYSPNVMFRGTPCIWVNLFNTVTIRNTFFKTITKIANKGLFCQILVSPNITVEY